MMSPRSFAKELEFRLATLPDEPLRGILRKLAREVRPGRRRALLAHLGSADGAAAQLASLAKLDALVPDIGKLAKRLRAVLGRPERMDRVRGFWGENSPYTDLESEVEGLFDRCRAAFALGRMELARDAYADLFAVLGVRDGYGFGLDRPASVTITEEHARYLRALVEATPADERATRLLGAMRNLSATQWDASGLSLRGVFEIGPAPLAGCEELLDGLIKLLREGTENVDDRWLREAVRLRRGAAGLAELARREGEWRPRAWTDWLELMAAEGGAARICAAAREALGGIPDGLNLRVLVANHWARAAADLGNKEAVLTARWEAFRAQPSPRHLVDLWAVAGDATARTKWMKRAVDCTLGRAVPLVAGPEIGGFGPADDAPFLEPGDAFDGVASEVMTVVCRLLAGDWHGAFAMAKRNEPLGGSSEGNVQAVVLPVMLAWQAGWPKRSLPTNLAALLDEALRGADNRDEPEPRTSVRLREALAYALPSWQETGRAGKPTPLDQSVALALARVNSMVRSVADDQHRGAYARAAVLACAAAELLQARNDTPGAERLLAGLLVRHQRKPSFKKELVACREG